MYATSQGLNRYQCRHADRSPRPLNTRKRTCRLVQIQLCSTGVLRSGENQVLDSREDIWSTTCYAINTECPNRCVCAQPDGCCFIMHRRFRGHWKSNHKGTPYNGSYRKLSTKHSKSEHVIPRTRRNTFSTKPRHPGKKQGGTRSTKKAQAQ